MSLKDKLADLGFSDETITMIVQKQHSIVAVIKEEEKLEKRLGVFRRKSTWFGDSDNILRDIYNYGLRNDGDLTWCSKEMASQSGAGAIDDKLLNYMEIDTNVKNTFIKESMEYKALRRFLLDKIIEKIEIEITIEIDPLCNDDSLTS